MTYQEQLNPWVIHQLSPNLTSSTVSRFRRRNEAESYLRILQQVRPNVQFTITFETNPVSRKATAPDLAAAGSVPSAKSK